MKKEKQELLLEILGNGRYRVNRELGVIESFIGGVWRELKGLVLPSGYKQHILFLGRGKGSKVIVYAHIGVYIGVNGVYEEGLVINHKDLNKLNNRPENLEAVSNKDNVNHSYENNKIIKEGQRYTSLIRYEQIEAIKKLLIDNPNWSKARVARHLGLNRIPVTRVINKIKNGEELKFEVPGKPRIYNGRFK